MGERHSKQHKKRAWINFKNAYLLTTVESGTCKCIFVCKPMNGALSSYSLRLTVDNNAIFKLTYYRHNHHTVEIRRRQII
jgi:hypothetical protein